MVRLFSLVPTSLTHSLSFSHTVRRLAESSKCHFVPRLMHVFVVDLYWLLAWLAGRLMKRGKLGRDMKTMRPRFFILKRGVLKYYEHENDLSREIGVVQLSYSTQIKVHPAYPRMIEICPGDNFVVAVRCLPLPYVALLTHPLMWIPV